MFDEEATQTTRCIGGRQDLQRAARGGGTMKVVVVDDERDVQALFEQRFRREIR